MTQELSEIYKGLTPKMRCALTTGSHTGYTCAGMRATLRALMRRGLIASDDRWTPLGWAVVLWIVANEPVWNPAYFKTPDDVHAEALALNDARESGGR